MFVIAFIFAYLFSRNNVNVLITLFPVTFITVGVGFVLHELAHKFVAIRYGFQAEFKMWVQGLIFAIITAYFGFVFAAPGAVYIHGDYISREENGKISLAGPVTNIILALFFLTLMFVPTSSQLITMIATFGFAVNSFLAFFNLIPVSILDGAKVLKWNPVVWGITAVLALILTVKAMFGMSV
nr:site-2 protease family protein [Methanobacterium paludis]